jgi:hypothetical protein
LKESYPAPPPNHLVDQPEIEDGAFFDVWAGVYDATERKGWNDEKVKAILNVLGGVYDATEKEGWNDKEVKGTFEYKQLEALGGWPHYDINGVVSQKFESTPAHQNFKDFGVYYSSSTDPSNAVETMIKERGRSGAAAEARSHRATIKKVYESCPDLFPSVSPEHLDLHDLSKFEALELFGYTCHWSRGETCLAQNKDLDYYEAALQHHYDHNKHHPEYYQNKGKYMKEEKYLEEMVIDKIASIWEREGPEHLTVYDFLTATRDNTEKFPFWSKLPNFYSKNVESSTTMSDGQENKDYVNKLVERLIAAQCGAQQG